MARLPTPQMLKRIAEAAHGNQDFPEIYVVASHVFPHEVAVFSERSTAVSSIKTEDLELFGPYAGNISYFNAPNANKIKSIRVTLQGEDGKEEIVEYDPSRVDAIFLSLSAVEKFVAPYYAGLYGVDYAKTLIDDYKRLGRFERPHDRNTRW